MRQSFTVVFTLAGLAVSAVAGAQVQTPSNAPKFFNCPRHNPQYSVACSTETDCSAKAADHNCRAHGDCAPVRETTAPEKMMPFPLALGVAGFLVGDQVVFTDTGNKMNTTFGWSGVSAGSVLVMAINSGKMSRGTALF